MTNFTNVFGGSPVQPSQVAYLSYALTGSLSLNWPTSFIDTTNVVARIMNVSANAINYSLIMPSAENVSVGADFLVFNTGSNAFTVVTNGLTTIATIGAGQAWYIWLTDNTTVNGTWSAIQFGTGTSSAVASALAGNGLIALNGLLNTNFPPKGISTNYTSTSMDRAYVLNWTGGTGSITLPAVGGLITGYYCAVTNQGTGLLTIQTPDSSTIDQMSTFPMNPGTTSFFIYTNSANSTWNSLGFGQASSSSGITALPPLNISGSATTTLTSTQAAYTILQFTGALTQNATVVFPARVGQWYVFNNTTNAFTVTAQLGSGGNTILIPQGGNFDLYSDGTNFYIIPQLQAGTLVTSITGTANQITASPSTGAVTLSMPASVVISTSVKAGNMELIGNTLESTNSNGNVILAPNGTGVIQINNGTNATPLEFYNSAGTHYVGFQAGTLSGNTLWTLPTTDSTGTQALVSNGSGALSWSSTPIGAGGLQSFTILTSGTAQTYTVPSLINSILVDCVGGGGGGGGVAGLTGGAAAGGGGGAGGYCRKWYLSIGSGSTATYTVGATAAGGAPGQHAGTNGNNTTFSGMTANGGTGGPASGSTNASAFGALGGAGGSSSGGDINMTGGVGSYGFFFIGDASLSGSGGNSIFGGGAPAVYTTSSTNTGSNAATNSGGGGSGGGAYNVTANAGGGTGAAGIIIVAQFS